MAERIARRAEHSTPAALQNAWVDLRHESCHGIDGRGTMLSKTAKPRLLECKDRGRLCAENQDFVLVPAGTQISCGDCHENEILDFFAGR